MNCIVFWQPALFVLTYKFLRQPSADNSSSLRSKLISSKAPTYDFYLRELLRTELAYLLTYLLMFACFSYDE